MCNKNRQGKKPFDPFLFALYSPGNRKKGKRAKLNFTVWRKNEFLAKLHDFSDFKAYFHVRHDWFCFIFGKYSSKTYKIQEKCPKTTEKVIFCLVLEFTFILCNYNDTIIKNGKWQFFGQIDLPFYVSDFLLRGGLQWKFWSLNGFLGLYMMFFNKSQLLRDDQYCVYFQTKQKKFLTKLIICLSSNYLVYNNSIV